jgi:hypothetical protein
MPIGSMNTLAKLPVLKKISNSAISAKNWELNPLPASMQNGPKKLNDGNNPMTFINIGMFLYFIIVAIGTFSVTYSIFQGFK